VTPVPLPDPLVFRDGTTVKDTAAWRTKRRLELLELFAAHVYGRTPRGRVVPAVDNFAEHDDALGGRAILRQARLRFDARGHACAIHVLTFLPKARRPAPAFLGLNFKGNAAVHADARIASSAGAIGAAGSESSRWPVETIVDRGYALVTACYGDIDPDEDDFGNGIHPLFYEAGQMKPAPDEWGAIGAWAWGTSRMLDHLERDRDIDAARVAVMGHSRLGKAALWAAAQDERFALAISNGSGRGGAAVARRRSGETMTQINTAYPHWFCGNFRQYNDREDGLPIDQHELIALIAPRPVLVCSAEDDAWADPPGEFMGARGADEIYRLLGTDGLATRDMPPPGSPILSTIGYHVRRGGHDVTDVDWGVFLDFADRHLRR
jgi:hypothetical protein